MVTDERVEDVAARLYKKGYHGIGIAFIMSVLAEEHPEHSQQYQRYMRARDEYMARGTT